MLINKSLDKPDLILLDLDRISVERFLIAFIQLRLEEILQDWDFQ